MLGTLSYLNTIESNLAGFGRYLSKAVAAILYQNTVGDFVYNVDESGNTVLDNRGAAGSAYDGLPYSGRGIELGATNDVDIPIHHTLGNSTSTYSSSQEGTATPIADGVNIVVSAPTSGSTYPRTFFTLSNTITEGNTYLVSFDVVVNSGTVVNQGIYVGGGTSTQLSSGLGSLTTGHYEVEITVDYTVSDSTLISLSFDGFNNTFDVDITNLISEQITNPNSYLTYYDFTDGLVTLGNSVDGGSSEELVTNGTFDTDTDWTKGNGTNWTIANGKATNDGTNDWTLTQSNVFEVGKTYHVSFDILDYTSGIVSLYVDSSFVFTVSSNGAYSTTITPKTSTSLTFYPRSTFIGSMDNVSVKEILPISTTYTLNTKTVNNFLTHTTAWSTSDWTKINNNPNLVGKLAVETLGATKTISELDMVADRGPELVTNGTFDADTDWTKIDSVISGGVVTFTPTVIGNTIFISAISGSFESGKTYELNYDVTANTLTSADFRIDFGGGDIKALPSTIGSHTVIIEASSVRPIRLESYVNTVGGSASVDNFSIKEVVQDSYYMCSENGVLDSGNQTLIDARSAGTNQITAFNSAQAPIVATGTYPSKNFTCDGTGTVSWIFYTLSQSLVGKHCIVTMDIGVNSGSVTIRSVTGQTPSSMLKNFTSDGTIKCIGVFDDTTLFGIYVNSNVAFDIDITNIQVREATATEIANYASTVRTNADFQQKGIQTTAFVTDGAGVPTEYSSNLLQFNGDGRYVDTGWIPSFTEDFTISIIGKLDNTAILQLHGTSAGYGASDLRIGHGSGDAVRLYANGANLSVAKASGSYYKADIVNDTALDKLLFYVNGVYVSFISTIGAGLLSDFWIGRTNGTPYQLYSPSGLPEIKTKASTATEVATEYAKSKSIYPSLP